MKKDFLFDLLPIIYRERDFARHGPLQALMETLQEPIDAIEDDIAALYDNWFIETCDQWVIPYMADLLGVRGLSIERNIPFGERSHVANTIAYRRRKGTAAILNKAVEDVTAWKSRVVEFSELTAATQSMKHVRTAIKRTIDVRAPQVPAGVSGPFTLASHSADLRDIDTAGDRHAPSGGLRHGKYQMTNVGIFLWRLAGYPRTAALAREIQPGRYTFHPFGIDLPLHNNPRTSTRFDLVADEENLPVPLLRSTLATEIRARRRGQMPPSQYFDTPAAFEVAIAPDAKSPLAYVPCEQIAIADLADWNFPSNADPAAIQVAVDPERGRLLFPDGVRPPAVRVSYCYAFSADIGGGPYWRDSAARAPAWHARVFDGATPGAGFPTLQDAIAAWSARQSDDGGEAVIQIADSSTHTLPGLSIDLGGRRLVIEAAPGQAPCIAGNIDVSGTGAGAELALNGLWIDGTVSLKDNLGLTVTHCTVWPAGNATAPAITSANEAPAVRVAIIGSITGPLRLSERIFQLEMRESIVDGRGGPAIAGLGGSATAPVIGPPSAFDRVTLLGAVHIAMMTAASQTIFAQPARVKRCDSGYVRYSYVAPGSKTPRRYFCVPEVEPGSANSDRAVGWIKSRFTSQRLGDPGYAQLSRLCPRAILTLAQDGGEPGAFHHLHQAERESRLRAILNEYLPYGLDAGIFYMS